ncbi:MAG: glycerophosphodiester phosphodiesterase family protein [Mariprofundus sp.]|nr:glycerophosphodiester phosphodiesterase family protein [Mariprofundus sp.]
MPPGSVHLARFLVAHRGDQTCAVENTLTAFSAAARAGARFLECDIQFSKDFEAFVLHDNRLGKLNIGSTAKVSRFTCSELFEKTAGIYPLLTFKALLQWLEHYPDVTLFAELKPSILRRKSPKQAVHTVLSMIPEKLQSQIVLISQSALLVEACSQYFSGDVGWVSEYHRAPNAVFSYLFLPVNRAEETTVWQQHGVRCAVYTVNDAKQARVLLAAGIDLIETNHFGRMKKELAND